MSARYHDKVVANAVIGTTESEAWAVGKRDGVDVVTSDPVYHNNSKYYASLAEQHESRALTAETNAKASETSAAESSSNATVQATAAAASAETATDKANDAATSASNAAESATASANSASASATSAQESATSATSSANYASDAAESAAAALASQQAAETSETNAAAHETNANASSVAASKSETAAKTSETNAKSSETAAKTSETNASASESIAVSKASEASASASAAKTSETNANTYYEKTKTLADSITGALKPMGTITFEDLPLLVDVSEGCMYNISNQFVTTSEFKEGAGTIVPIGSNVYKTSDGYWDILAGTPVAGVKGENEPSYRTGNVNITKENIGLGNVDNTSDNKKSVLSATKLSTARKIGNASFDGTKDITLKETGALDPIGDEFNSSLTYVVGDFCIYNNTLYKCTTAIDTASEWDESKWEATTVATELSLGSDNSVTLTRAEYDALSDKEKDSNTTYYISDEGAESNAFSVPFTSDKYTATNTGDALIEVKTKLEETNSNLVQISYQGAGSHNAIYRGKNLGTSVTEAQYAAISAGTFDDLYIGDYWVINGVTWRIAAFDYYLRCGDSDLTTHHAVIVPDSVLYYHVMNDTNTTEGGYVGSKMYREGLEQAKTTIKAAFSGHVLSHRIYLTNAVANGKPSAGAWYDSEVDLMNEQMVYGTGIFSPVSDGSTVLANHRVEKSQLPLFTHRPDLISIRVYYWLRDVVTAAHFAFVASYGLADSAYASGSLGVRLAFCIKG